MAELESGVCILEAESHAQVGNSSILGIGLESMAVVYLGQMQGGVWEKIPCCLEKIIALYHGV